MSPTRAAESTAAAVEPASAEPTGPGTGTGTPGEGQLSRSLKRRHLSMIALGGVIGAGLFVGSGSGIASAGPSIVVAFALSGLLVMLVMRMLGEMSAAHPATGSFSVHAEREIGPWAGLTAGWMYWAMLTLGVAAEATAAGGIIHGWLPFLPAWGWVLVFMAFFCLTNCTAVKNYGEFEFWFAAIKVAAIVAFLVVGVLAICGVIDTAPGASNLTGDGGFMPHGAGGLISGILATAFAYGGLETVTIASAESDDPVRNVTGAVRTAMWRIALFYVGSMLVVVTLVPWNDPAVATDGPYVAVLDHLHIPAAGQIMNVVVLIALLSAMNANIYGSSRMAYSLVRRGQGPRALARVSGGVPRLAVIASCGFGFLAVLAGVLWPTTVFTWLMNMVGAAVLVVWGFIAVAQLRMRRRLEREAPERLVLRMWLFPVLSWVALLAVLAVLALMTLHQDTLTQLYFTGGLTAVLALLGVAAQRRRKRSAAAA
ncbi:amino acid permease [Phaeacidiphilus oryzae]|uniref:amino acid permease n=1 Tax=Phaeacidiphilus oryzae TaxID=348818 RepID=UPI000A4DB775|nr:amino acid permease [Phaeacidiphilus oryzae]